jgi:hypothetical protein
MQKGLEWSNLIMPEIDELIKEKFVITDADKKDMIQI